MLARRIHDGLEPAATVVDLHVYDRFTERPGAAAAETAQTEEDAA